MQKEKQIIKTQFRDQALLCNITNNGKDNKQNPMVLSSDQCDESSHSPDRHAMKQAQIKMAANRRDVFEAEEEVEDYFSEPYEDFGDVEDVGVLTSDPEQREYERDQGFPISSSSS